jgi:hypothetical protein
VSYLADSHKPFNSWPSASLDLLERISEVEEEDDDDDDDMFIDKAACNTKEI